MARSYVSKKNSKNSLIMIIVAIILVVAAIAFVVYDEYSYRSQFFENINFSKAVSEVMGKLPAFISEDDISQIKYLEANYSVEDDMYFIAVGKNDFLEQYKLMLDLSEKGEDTTEVMNNLQGLFKGAWFSIDDGENLDDIKNFTEVEILNITGTPVSSSDVFSSMKGLTHAYITNCGLTEVSGFGSLNFENVVEMNLSSNNISDWSALDSISDKVIVNTYYTIEPSEDGTIDYNNIVTVEKTLTEYYEELAKEQEETTASASDEQ